MYPFASTREETQWANPEVLFQLSIYRLKADLVDLSVLLGQKSWTQVSAALGPSPSFGPNHKAVSSHSRPHLINDTNGPGLWYAFGVIF